MSLRVVVRSPVEVDADGFSTSLTVHAGHTRPGLPDAVYARLALE